MKHGAPIRDVNMETGISDAVTDRAAVSMISMNTAPNAMLAGMTELLSLPNIMRTIWGMSSPTHPIWPHMDTTAAVTMADPTITSPRILLTGIPRDLASSSGRDMELSFHLNRNSSTLPIRMNGAPMTRVALVVLAMLPMFLLAMYEKNGQPLEVIIRQFVEVKFLRPKERPYQTNNFYTALARQERLDKEVRAIVKGKGKDPKQKA